MHLETRAFPPLPNQTHLPFQNQIKKPDVPIAICYRQYNLLQSDCQGFANLLRETRATQGRERKDFY
ncbi:hypothetical protein EI42_05717 [Thermosporothrix hazakensis]|jgi:hypothetical protein|uniref:Uncharacterized protein n=1 Tax=Thermosporothrix hazakensis TaxID=644383 RepID=A0A326U900_THEHA|nr:hypothetical protein EI42_05717 [Thermosporothrix hazakensis]